MRRILTRPRGGAVTAPAAVETAPPRSEAMAELARKRDELAERFTQRQWDLGGLTYEMARRDHFRLDVLVRQAAQLQEVDAELAEAERMLRLDDAAASGTCRSCGALHARGAVFCWQCGAPLLPRTPVHGQVASP